MSLFRKLIKIHGNNNQIISPREKVNRLYRRSPIEINGNNNIINVDSNNNIYKFHIIITGNNNTVTVDRNLQGVLKLVISGNNCNVHIGKDCLFRGCEMAVFENNSVLEFGDGSMAARDSRIYASDFHTIYDINTKQPINQGTHIRIGKHVWIGEGVLILKNHTIADNNIIAAHSVVTKDLLESNAIYAGNPASLKKSQVNWDYRQYDEYVNDLNK